MPLTRTWPIYRDTLLAKSGSTPLGGGNDEHLPIGVAGSYDCKAALKFSLDWTNVTRIVSARIYLKTTTKVHALSWGASPTLVIERQTGGNFSENSGRSSYDDPPGSGWSGATSDFDDVPNGSNDISWLVGTGTPNESTWFSCDITAIVNQWAPTAVLQSNGSPGGNQPNYGIDIRPSAYTTAETVEFYSRKSGADPYMVLTYESNTAPTVTLVSPVGGVTIADLNPVFTFILNDADGDTMTSFDIQLDTTTGNNVVPDWASLVHDFHQDGSFPPSDPVYYGGGLSLTRGQWYAWRVRATDPEGAVGAWSVGYFKVNSLPTYTTRDPGSNDFAYIHNLGSSLAAWTNGGTDGRPRLSFVYSDPDGDAMTKVRVKVWDDSGGSKGAQRYDTGEVVIGAASGATVIVDVGDKVTVGGNSVSLAATQSGTAGLVRGTRYWWSIEVWDVESSGSVDSSTPTQFAIQWGQGIWEYAPSGGSSSSQWSFKSAAFSQGQGAILFRTATGAGGAGASAWVDNIGLLEPNTYLNVMVRLATQVPGTNTLLPDMTFDYFGSGSLPDRWTLYGSGTMSLVTGVRRFGTKALLVTTAASNSGMYPWRKTSGDDVPVVTNTDYVVSAYVKTPSVLNGKVHLAVYVSGGGTAIVDGVSVTGAFTQDSSSYPDGWQRLYLKFNSGGNSLVRPALVYTGSTAGEKFYWDGVALTEGDVLPPWQPGFIANAVILDSNGIAIDAAAGAIFRLRGSSGGVDDVVELGDNGLTIGSDLARINAGIRQAKRIWR